MISVTIDQLYAWINAFIWPFIRIAAMVGSAPLLSESAIPARVKVGLSVMLTLIVAPSLGPMPSLATSSWAALWIMGQQILIGLALGLTMRIIFAAVQTAGEFIGLQMGLSFASFFDPSTGSNTAVLARILNTVTLLVFIALNGHLLMIGGLLRTFEVLPIMVGELDVNGWGVILEWSSQIVVSGLLMALPVMIVLLTINLSLGILNRTAQQLSVFAVGFPISLTVGLTILAVVLPQISPFLEQLFQDGYDTMGKLVQGLAGN
ncbi:MAG TPA: flagellar biosynthetic protein FliR [Burkholderiaceae bacterium]|nr:flagellar biosynthetic protein FliR [Burkholderiaceae bacterium]